MFFQLQIQQEKANLYLSRSRGKIMTLTQGWVIDSIVTLVQTVWAWA